MAELFPIPDDIWQGFLKSLPDNVREIAIKYPQNVLYKLKGGELKVYISKYHEKGTLTVMATGDYNYVPVAQEIYNVPPEALEETDLPGPDEKLGTTYETVEDLNQAMSGKVH